MRRVNATSCYRRRPAAVSTGKLTPWLFPAGDPRTAPSAHQRTKPQTPCTQQLRSACVSYRLTLAAAALCNPNAPAPWCQSAPLLKPLTSHSVTKILPSRYPSWACGAVGSARGDRLHPPDGLLAFLRQWPPDPPRTRGRWF